MMTRHKGYGARDVYGQEEEEYGFGGWYEG